jgi:hypothetical protein
VRGTLTFLAGTALAAVVAATLLVAGLGLREAQAGSAARAWELVLGRQLPSFLVYVVVTAAVGCAAQRLLCWAWPRLPAALTGALVGVLVPFAYLCSIVAFKNPTGRAFLESLDYARFDVLCLCLPFGVAVAAAAGVFCRSRR